MYIFLACALNCLNCSYVPSVRPELPDRSEPDDPQLPAAGLGYVVEPFEENPA
jgi:hypothetical protein